MNISWLGTASILIETKETSILIDPYMNNDNLEPVYRKILHRVDAIFITHPHFDHFSSIEYFIKHCQAPIYVCIRGIEIARKRGLPIHRFYEIKKDSVITYKDATIEMYQGSHCKFDKGIVYNTLKRTILPKNIVAALKIGYVHRQYQIAMIEDVLSFAVSIEGKSVFIMGSANLCEDVRYPQNMDLLVYPYQGRSDMAMYSLAIIERLKPKAVMLDHFDDSFSPISCLMDTRVFISMMQDKYPNIKVFEPNINTKYGV